MNNFLAGDECCLSPEARRGVKCERLRGPCGRAGARQAADEHGGYAADVAGTLGKERVQPSSAGSADERSSTPPSELVFGFYGSPTIVTGVDCALVLFAAPTLSVRDGTPFDSASRVEALKIMRWPQLPVAALRR